MRAEVNDYSKTNPTGEIILIATCLIAKVLMINKINRTGQKFPSCLGSLGSRASQCIAGLTAAWGPGQDPPSRDAWQRGEIGVIANEMVPFHPYNWKK